MMEHTSGPLKVAQSLISLLLDESGEIVAEICTLRPVGQDEADAARIKLCWNSYNSLETIKQAAAKLCQCFPPKGEEGNFNIPSYALEELRQALEAVEEAEAAQGGA